MRFSVLVAEKDAFARWDAADDAEQEGARELPETYSVEVRPTIDMEAG